MGVHAVFVPSKSSHADRILGDVEILWICAVLQSLFEVKEHSWAINPNGTRAREYASTQKPGETEFLVSC